MSPSKRRPRSTRRASNHAVPPAASATRGTKGFLPKVLDQTVIAIPLLHELDEKPKGSLFDVVIDVNLNFAGGRKAACTRVQEMIGKLAPGRQTDRRPHRDDPELKSEQYVFASLDADTIRALVRMDSRGGRAPRTRRAIYHIWPDFPLKRLVNKSISTVKADAAHNAFAALGDDIIWAVIDSGIDGTHPHFRKHKNLEGLPGAVKHRDFTSAVEAPLADRSGHGAHVAGIIAGQMTGSRIVATTRHLDERGRPTDVTTTLPAISGMAPRAKLLSLKVLDEDGRGNGTGKASSIISALEYIQKLNGDGRASSSRASI